MKLFLLDGMNTDNLMIVLPVIICRWISEGMAFHNTSDGTFLHFDHRSVDGSVLRTDCIHHINSRGTHQQSAVVHSKNPFRITFDEEESGAGDGWSDYIIGGSARVIGNVVDWVQPSIGPPTSVKGQR